MTSYKAKEELNKFIFNHRKHETNWLQYIVRPFFLAPQSMILLQEVTFGL